MVEPNCVGVVTVTYNSGSVIDDFLESLLSQQCTNFRVYIVDNASSDETLHRVSTHADDRIVVISNSINKGVAEGNNIGIYAAFADGCDEILLINNDTVFESNLITELKAALYSHKSEMVVPKILYFDNPGKIWCAGGYFTSATGTSRHYGYNQEDTGQFNESRLVSYSPTCCMLIKKNVFERIGFMDAKYFVYFDDTDFCYRAMHGGCKLLYWPSVSLLHKVSSLTGGESEFTTRFCTRNHVYFILKNLPPWKIALYLPIFQMRLLVKHIFVSRSLNTLLKTQRAFLAGIALFLFSEKNVGFTELERQR